MIVLQLTFRRKSLSVTLTLTDASFSAVVQFELLKSLLEKIWRFEDFDYWSSWNVWDTHSTGAVCVCVVLKHEMTECVSWSMCDSLSATHPADESLIVFTLYLLMNLKCSYGEDRASLCVCTTISSLIHYFWQFWCSVFLVVLLNDSVFTGLQREPLSVCSVEKWLLYSLTSFYFV